MRATILLALAAVLGAGCSSSGKNASYHFSSTTWDSYAMGALNVESLPPNARVYAKLRYKSTADMKMPQGEVSQDFSAQFDHPMKDWTLVGTTPVADFQVLLSGKSSDHHLTSAAYFNVQLDDLSLRIEKEGFNTLELNHVGFISGKSKLTLELVPAGATTRPAQVAKE